VKAMIRELSCRDAQDLGSPFCSAHTGRHGQRLSVTYY
jgi:hypothetical protein